MAYTGHDEFSPQDPPTFALVGENDRIAPPEVMERRVNALRNAGVNVAWRRYPGVAHGFGIVRINGGADRALLPRLALDLVAADQLDAAVERELADLLQCAPGAVAATKKLIAYVHSHDLSTNMIYAADKLADAWETEEGREGIAAFFGKRLPAWRQA